MNPTSHRIVSVFPVVQLSAVASLFFFSACATSFTPPASLGAPLIAAIDLPPGATAPQVLRQVAPVFPTELKRAGVEGEAQLICLIGQNGEIRHIAADQASNPQFLDSARRALQGWKFAPGRNHGQPVAMSIAIPFRFVLVDAVAGPPPGIAYAAAP